MTCVVSWKNILTFREILHSSFTVPLYRQNHVKSSGRNDVWEVRKPHISINSVYNHRWMCTESNPADNFKLKLLENLRDSLLYVISASIGGFFCWKLKYLTLHTCISAPIGVLLLKLHTSYFPCIRYKWRNFGCNRSIHRSTSLWKPRFFSHVITTSFGGIPLELHISHSSHTRCK